MPPRRWKIRGSRCSPRTTCGSDGEPPTRAVGDPPPLWAGFATSPSHATPYAVSAAKERQNAAFERQLQIVVAVVDNLSAHDRLRDVRGMLERVAIIEHQIRDLPHLDAAVPPFDTEQLRGIDRHGLQSTLLIHPRGNGHRRFITQHARLGNVPSNPVQIVTGMPAASSAAALPVKE